MGTDYKLYSLWRTRKVPISNYCQGESHNNPHSLISKILTEQVNEIENRSINRNSAKNHWASLMKKFIENLGFPNMWRDQFEHVPPLQILKKRIRDQFAQHWYSQINNFSKLHYNAQYKSEFKVIENEKFRKTLTAFRVSAHNLEIERGRYRDENRELRLCNLCNLKQVESEYHFLLICPFYAALRQSYLGCTPWPSMLKFINTMDCSSRNFIMRLSKYVYFAMSRRSDAINGISDS